MRVTAKKEKNGQKGKERAKRKKRNFKKIGFPKEKNGLAGNCINTYKKVLSIQVC